MSAGATSVQVMPTPADHFTAFVDALPSTPRVARAVAGESPARFRGRVLLERAAYLMTSTDLTLQEIAADCGFARYDLFTRAFRREHGVLPSEWRAEPTSHLIDSPTDVHFHPPAGLRLPARQRMGGVDLVVEMVEHHVWVVGELVDRAGPLSEDQLDLELGPDLPEGGSLRRILTRLVDRLEEVASAVRDTTYDAVAEEGAPLAALRRRLDRAGPELVDGVSLVAATGRFDEAEVDAFSPTPAVLSHGARVAHLLTSAGHPCALAVLRLRECGVTDLDDLDPRRWLAGR